MDFTLNSDMYFKYYSKLDRAERLFFYTVIIAIFLGLCLSTFLPMTDLPQHAGQVAILKSAVLNNTQAPWFNEIEINYWTTYWIAYLVTLLFSFILPINYAINAVVGLAFIAFIFSFSSLRKQFNAPKLLDWVLIPSFFGLSYSWGFITFILAIPVGVFLIKQNLKLLAFAQAKYYVSVIICGVLLYFSHMLVFLFFCLIASSMTLVEKGYPIRKKIQQLLPFYLLALLIPLFIYSLDFFATSGLADYYPPSYLRLIYEGLGERLAFILLNPFSVVRDIYVPLDAISAVLLVLPFGLQYKLTKDIKRYIPLLVYLLVTLFLPMQMLKTNIIYPRFSIFLYPFYILLFDKRKDDLVKDMGVVFVCAILWIISCLFLVHYAVSDLISFNKETKSFNQLLSKLPKNKRALSLVYSPYSNIQRDAATYVYFPLWYQALKEGWVDFNFAWYPPQVIRFKVNSVPEVRLGDAWNASRFISLKHCDKYDLIFVRAETLEKIRQHDANMQKSNCKHQLKYHNKSWYVYGL